MYSLPNKLSIAKKIKQLRKKTLLSQSRFGIKLGVSGKTISAYENGRCVPPTDILVKIAEVFGEPFLHIRDEDCKAISQRLSIIKDELANIERLFISQN